MRGVLAVFEPRLGHLSWHVVAPSPPDDVTPDLVRQAVAGSPGAVAVELSAAFLHRRPGSDVGAWRRLDQELESEGIAVYFAPGGAAAWEIKVSTWPPPAAAKATESRPESPVEAVTPTNPSFWNGTRGVTGRTGWRERRCDGAGRIPHRGTCGPGSKHPEDRRGVGRGGLPRHLPHEGGPNVAAESSVAPGERIRLILAKQEAELAKRKLEAPSRKRAEFFAQSVFNPVTITPDGIIKVDVVLYPRKRRILCLVTWLANHRMFPERALRWQGKRLGYKYP